MRRRRRHNSAAPRRAPAERTPPAPSPRPVPEYASGSEVFRTKIGALADAYSGMRRSRGDGNCFFRSVLFSVLEGCLLRRDGGAGAAEAVRLREQLKAWTPKLAAAGFQEIVFEDALELVCDLLDALAAEPPRLSAEGLVSRFLDQTGSSYMIMLLRLVTSGELRLRAEHFAPFVEGMADGMAVDAFCQAHVEPLGEESDHIQAIALTDALGVAVRVVYLDATPGPLAQHDFVPEWAGAPALEGGRPPVVVLYRPGHFDVLYYR